MVITTSNPSLPGLPLPHDGAVHLCWIWCHVADDSTQFLPGLVEQEATGEADGTQGLKDQACQ